jgi:hypothetical protein
LTFHQLRNVFVKSASARGSSFLASSCFAANSEGAFSRATRRLSVARPNLLTRILLRTLSTSSECLQREPSALERADTKSVLRDIKRFLPEPLIYTNWDTPHKIKSCGVVTPSARGAAKHAQARTLREIYLIIRGSAVRFSCLDYWVPPKTI